MGFEGKRKPPEFVIRAAMQEDPDRLRRMASNGGKAAALSRRLAAEHKARLAEEEKARLRREQEAFDEEDRLAALEHAKKFHPPNED